MQERPDRLTPPLLQPHANRRTIALHPINGPPPIYATHKAQPVREDQQCALLVPPEQAHEALAHRADEGGEDELVVDGARQRHHGRQHAQRHVIRAALRREHRVEPAQRHEVGQDAVDAGGLLGQRLRVCALFVVRRGVHRQQHAALAKRPAVDQQRDQAQLQGQPVQPIRRRAEHPRVPRRGPLDEAEGHEVQHHASQDDRVGVVLAQWRGDLGLEGCESLLPMRDLGDPMRGLRCFEAPQVRGCDGEDCVHEVRSLLRRALAD